MGSHRTWLWLAVIVASTATTTLAAADTVSAGPNRRTDELACGERRSFWASIRLGDSTRYCRLLGLARARLQAEPAVARDIAKRAIATRGEPAVVAHLLLAEAELLLGEFDRAHEGFTSVASDMSDRATAHLLHPRAVVAGARAALVTGHYQEALERYRWVLLRLGDLHDPREEARVLIEAATAASYSAPDRGREARAYLASAIAKNAPLLRPIAEAAWALSLLRDGQRERAARRVSQFESSWAFVWMFEGSEPSVGKRGEVLPVLPPGEKWAWAAVVAEGVEPEAASLHWDEFLAEAAGRLPSHVDPESQE